MTDLTGREILEACARACGIDAYWSVDGSRQARPIFVTLCGGGMGTMPYEDEWNPIKHDCDCARMENKFGVEMDSLRGRVYRQTVNTLTLELFTPGNNAERRRASCLVVARAQIEKEKGGNHD